MSGVKIIRYYFNRIFCTALLLLLFSALNAQEICNNGIDDNANGLIDLNDTAACNCLPQPPSLIQNSSFELKNCCPSTYSQLNCAQGWIQASGATSDYFNTCGFIFPAATAAGLIPLPDGSGMAGFISSIGYQEYIGSALTSPMLNDSTYSLQLKIASTPIDGQGAVCNGGIINYAPSYIVIYGSTDSTNMPFAGIGCPQAPQWQILDSVLYTPVSTWGTLDFEITPSVDINAIIIGSPCTLPSSYGPDGGCYPYFYVDNLELNKTEPDSSINKFTAINQSGSWCTNSTVLTGDTIAGATYQWYHNGIAIVGQTSNVLNVSANNLPIGLYSMSITLGSACKYNSINVIQYANPPVIGQSSSSFCKSDPPGTLTANITGGIWSGSGITNSATGTFNPANASVGNNTVIYTLPNAGACQRADTVNIIVNAAPISNAGRDTTICAGSPLTIGGPSTAGYFYSWSPTNGLSNPFGSAPSFTLANNTGAPITANYSLITTNSLTGCQALDQIVIIVNPAATINPVGPFCKNDPGGILTASTSGGTWSGSGIINANFGTFSPAAANIGNNLITYTLTGACGGGDTAVIVVTPPIVSNAGANVSVCAGDSVLIGANSTPGYTYSWQPSAGLNNSTLSQPYVLATNSGTTPLVVSYVLTTAFNGCTGKDTLTVTINPQPQLEITNPNAVCASIPVDITLPSVTSGTSGGGVYSYWTNSTATTVLTNPSAINTAGTYYIKATATGGCFDIQPVVVALNATPTANAGNDISICTEDTVLIGVDSVPGNTYSWTPTTGINNPSISKPSITLTNNGNAPQTLVYVVTATANSCSDSDTINITVNPHPVADAGTDIEVCAGSEATLNGAVLGVSAGSWSGGSGTYSPSNNALNAEYTPTITELTQGSVSLILTTDIPQGGCAAAKDTVVLTFALPAIANAGNNDTICAGGAAILDGSYTGVATSGSWNGGDGVFSPDNNQLNASYTPSAAEIEAGSVALIFTTNDPASACLADTDTVLIEIQPSPLANAGANQFVCAGSEINLSGSISGSATSATWSGGQGTFSPSVNSLTPIYSPSINEQNADSVVLFITTDNPIGFPCNAYTDSVIIHFYPKPIANFTANEPAGCPQHCVDFSDLTNTNGGSNINAWAWSYGDNTPVDTIQNPAHCFISTGLYDVTLIVTSQDNCKDTLAMPQFIQVYATPSAGFDYTPNPATVSSTNITLNNLSSPDVALWMWGFGDGDSLVSDSSGAVHLYPNAAPGTYQTTLVVENSFGCADTTTNNVIIYPEFSFFIPNAFTPNGDDINDFFGAKGMGIETYELFIFDRWGNSVFYADDINKMWDGTFVATEETVLQDIFVWKVNLTDVFRKKYNYIGTVTIIR